MRHRILYKRILKMQAFFAPGMKFFDKISPDGGGEDLAGSAIYFVSILYCLCSVVCCPAFYGRCEKK